MIINDHWAKTNTTDWHRQNCVSFQASGDDSAIRPTCCLSLDGAIVNSTVSFCINGLWSRLCRSWLTACQGLKTRNIGSSDGIAVWNGNIWHVWSAYVCLLAAQRPKSESLNLVRVCVCKCLVLKNVYHCLSFYLIIWFFTLSKWPHSVRGLPKTSDLVGAWHRLMHITFSLVKCEKCEKHMCATCATVTRTFRVVDTAGAARVGLKVCKVVIEFTWVHKGYRLLYGYCIPFQCLSPFRQFRFAKNVHALDRKHAPPSWHHLDPSTQETEK